MKAMLFAVATTIPILAGPAWAQDAAADPDTAADIEAGQTVFQRQCITCHVIADAEGEVIVGRSARIGPNLYGVMGAEPASAHDFNYSDDLVAYGETGTVWETESMAAYLQGPTPFLQDALDDPGARSRMAYRVPDADVARQLAVFLGEYGVEEPAAEADDLHDDGADNGHDTAD